MRYEVEAEGYEKDSKWVLHSCPFDKECRKHGAPWRVHLNTPWFHLALALNRNATFGRATWNEESGSWGEPFTTRWHDFRRYPKGQGHP